MDTSFSIAARSDSSGPVQRACHGHERRAERREERREARREDRSEAFAELKLKVKETLHGLTQTDGGDEGSDSSGFDAKFELSLKISGSASDGSDFAGALQSFSEALFSALKTLYGAEPQTPSSTVSAPVLADAGATAAAPEVATTTDTTAAPATTDIAATTTEPDPAAGLETTPPATTTAAPNAGSVSIRLRLTYSSFDHQFGPLTNRLAQPGIGNDVPAVGAMFGDLAERFSQLLSAAPAGDGDRPSFASFLSALAQKFAGPAPDTSVSAPAEAPADAVTPPATPSTAYSASVAYRQLMAYEDAAGSFTLQASLRSRMVYATA